MLQNFYFQSLHWQLMKLHLKYIILYNRNFVLKIVHVILHNINSSLIHICNNVTLEELSHLFCILKCYANFKIEMLISKKSFFFSPQVGK